MTHECIVQGERDAFAYVEQYLVRCRCHMDSWKTWRPGDEPPTCPEGTALVVEVAK
jgi:hypothetical protein